MGRALGLIETIGFVAAVEAADAAHKAAHVQMTRNYENAEGGLITIQLRGELAAVQAAVDAAAQAARRIGQVVSALVIPNPVDDIDEYF